MKRKWDTASPEIQKKCVDEVIARIDELDGDSPGVIASQEIIDIVVENLGPEIYNAGVRDAKKLIGERIIDIETEIDLLQQSA